MSAVPSLGRVSLDVTIMSLIYTEVVKLPREVEDRCLWTRRHRPLLSIPGQSC